VVVTDEVVVVVVDTLEVATKLWEQEFNSLVLRVDSLSALFCSPPLGLNLDKNGQPLLRSFDACGNAKGERREPPLKVRASIQTVCYARWIFHVQGCPFLSIVCKTPKYQFNWRYNDANNSRRKWRNWVSLTPI